MLEKFEIGNLKNYTNDEILNDVEKEEKSNLLIECSVSKNFKDIDSLLERLNSIDEKYYLKYGTIIMNCIIGDLEEEKEIDYLTKVKKVKFPINALPNSITEYVIAVSEDLQVPIDMVAVTVFAVFCTILQGKYNVLVKNDWVEPLNLFFTIVALPSERKSPVIMTLTKPIIEFEHEENEKLKPEMLKSKMKKEHLNVKKDKIIKRSSNDGKDIDNELEKITNELLEFKEINPVKVFSDDVTPEKLTSLLAQNNNKMSIISCEGGIFEMMAGKYTQSTNFDVFLKGYSGDILKVDRIGRESEIIENPKLSVLLAIQPTVLESILGNKDFRGKGLLSRFLYCYPDSMVGNRKFDTPKVDEKLAGEYNNKVKYFLSLDDTETKTLKLNSEALEKFKEFYDLLESKMNYDYNNMSDWCGKLSGNTARMSGIISLINNKESNEITKQDIESAIEIAKYFLQNAINIFQSSAFSKSVKDALYILEYIEKEKKFYFKIRELVRARGRFYDNLDAKAGLDELIRRKYIFYYLKERIYIVNPKIYTDLD